MRGEGNLSSGVPAGFPQLSMVLYPLRGGLITTWGGGVGHPLGQKGKVGPAQG